MKKKVEIDLIYILNSKCYNKDNNKGCVIMYNINIKKIEKQSHLHLGFLIFGFLLFLIIVGIIIFYYKSLIGLDSSIMSRGVRVKSHINRDGITMYSSIYYYRVDGIDYSCSLHSSSHTKPSTENKKVYYDSKKPSKCMPNHFVLDIKTCFLLLLIPIFIIVFSLNNIKKVKKKTKIIKELNKKGKLIKNIPYQSKHNHKFIVNYMLPSGNMVLLYGNLSYNKKSEDVGTVDLVIDEDNPKNYYIDVEINRLSGNLPQDYFNPIPQNNPPFDNEIECLTDDDTVTI